MLPGHIYISVYGQESTCAAVDIPVPSGSRPKTFVRTSSQLVRVVFCTCIPLGFLRDLDNPQQLAADGGENRECARLQASQRSTLYYSHFGSVLVRFRTIGRMDFGIIG